MGNVRACRSRPACAACKHQRRRCLPDCITAPYFPAECSVQFLAVHRHFGLGSILRFIKEAPPKHRDRTVETMIFEAEARSHDPVNGCLSIIRDLKTKIDAARRELEATRQQVRICRELHKRQQEIHELKEQLLALGGQQQAHLQLDMHQQQSQPQLEFSMSMIKRLLDICGMTDQEDEVISCQRSPANLGEISLSNEVVLRTIEDKQHFPGYFYDAGGKEVSVVQSEDKLQRPGAKICTDDYPTSIFDTLEALFD